LEVTLAVQEARGASPQHAPLIVVLPGLGNDLGSPLARLATRNFFERGYHVLVVPNSFSHTFLRARPLIELADIVGEAAAVLELIDAALSKVGPNRVRTVHLYGESFGGLTAAIVKALDVARLDGHSRITGSTTLVGPPTSYVTGMRCVDALIEKVRCRPRAGDWAALFWTCCGFEACRKRTAAVMEYVVADYFKRQVVANARRASSFSANSPGVVESSRIDTNRKATSVVLAPHRDPFATGEVNGRYFLDHWLGLLRAAGCSDWRVLTACDDFVNEPGTLASLHGVKGTDHLIELPGGGHLGYLGWPEIEELLDLAFAIPRT
jgi:hypothetical protein